MARDVMTPEEAARWKIVSDASAQNLWKPFEYGGGYGAYEDALKDARGRMFAADNRAPILADSTAYDQQRAQEVPVRAAQGRAMDYYAAMAGGGGPSVATPQYNMAANQVMNSAAMQAGAAQGQGAQAGAQRAAMLGAAQGLGGAAGQYGQARLGEQLQGAQGYMGGANAMNQGDIARAALSAKWATNQAKSQLDQRGANMADAQAYAGLGTNIIQQQQQGAGDKLDQQHKLTVEERARIQAANDKIKTDSANALLQYGQMAGGLFSAGGRK